MLKRVTRCGWEACLVFVIGSSFEAENEALVVKESAWRVACLSRRTRRIFSQGVVSVKYIFTQFRVLGVQIRVPGSIFVRSGHVVHVGTT